MHHPLSRRGSLRWLGAAATTLAAGTMPAKLVFAATTGAAQATDNRLVVVLLRGALDGLAAVPAVGDPAWANLRGQADEATSLPPPLRLDATFAMHPALANLALQTGWLGRALESSHQSAMALTAAMPLALRGGAAASTWTPERRVTPDRDLMERVAQMYAAEPALHSAFSQALGQQDMAIGAEGGAGFNQLAKQAGVFLSDPQGPRVAWLEAGGWDTHTQQAPRLQRLLASLDDGLAALRSALGAHWAKTTVLVMTEFGRSAHYNGTGGTDHGTAGAAFVAGGAVAGGRVHTDWPGLAATNLLDKRDLKPTQDLRALIAPAVQRQFGLSTPQMQNDVFPGMTARPLQLWRA